MRLLALLLLALPALAAAQLDRGLLATRRTDGAVLVSWRLWPDDPADLAWHLDRLAADAPPVRLTATPHTGATCWLDADAPAGALRYRLVAARAGAESPAGESWRLPPAAIDPGYHRLALRTPPGYQPNDAAVGDLDGDGQLELVLKQELRGFDPAHDGVGPGSTRLQAYRLDGTFLWEVDLGPNIRSGAHYTPFIVADLDGDGRAELAVRAAEGTIDGTGAVIGDTDGDGRTNYVHPETGRILEGPEFLCVYDGRTGAERARVPYIARGQVSDWGDGYGNRVDRFLMAAADLGGPGLSVVACRGYYALTRLEAWDLGADGLTQRWSFSSADGVHGAYAGQGNHNLAVGDVDGDGRDEIIYGACAIDDDGRGLYTTGLGHGDALHLGDLDPARPGLEVFAVHEPTPSPAGWEFRDARTGALLWGLPTTRDVGRGVAADLDPRYPGAECWAAGGRSGLYSARGELIHETGPRSMNMAIWWRGEATRELLDGTRIIAWDWAAGAERTLLDAAADGAASNNGTKANPCLYGDLLGDWREEVLWRSADGRELYLYATPEPTALRRPSLLADPVYRLSLTHQNIGYNQPTQLGTPLVPAGD